MNKYETYLNKLVNLLPYSIEHFCPINSVITDITNDYVIRPSFTPGTETYISNLRTVESQIIYSFTVFVNHDSNTDPCEICLNIKESLKPLSEIYQFNIIRNDDSMFNAYTLQIYVND